MNNLEKKINKTFENYLDCKVNMEDIIEIIQFIATKKVIIYGAGSLGGILFDYLKRNNVNVDFILDKSADKIKNNFGVPIYTNEHLSKCKGNNKYLVIIAINKKSLSNSLQKELRDKYQGIDVIAGFELVRLLKYQECLKKHESGDSFNLVECAKCGFEERGCYFAESYTKMRTISSKWFLSTKFDWLGYIIGQSCTLKCKHCCEGVPYLKNPEFVTTEIIISDLQKVADSCKFLKYVELIGGEPFLHPDFDNLLRKLLCLNNVGYIKIFTNGTVTPDNSLCEILKDSRIVIHLSNYLNSVSQDLQEKIINTKKKFDENDISYIFIDSTNWLDFTSFRIRNISDEQLTNCFDNCFLADCHRLHNGILYRCPHQYSGVQSGDLTLKSGEYISINELDEEKLAKALDNFENMCFTEACRHCNMPYDAQEIITGEQIDRVTTK